MDEYRRQQHDIAERAAAALSLSWRAPVSLTDVTPLSNEKRRNVILRATTVGEGVSLRSVIIKVQRAADFDASTPNALEESGLVKEWTAAAFLGGHAPEGLHCPALLAGDAARGVIVFEDLGADLGSLVGPLLDGPADRAAAALVGYADCLGHLHAATLDCADGHAAALHRLFPNAATPRPANPQRLHASFAKVYDLLGGTLDESDVQRETAILLFARMFGSLSRLRDDALQEDTRWGIAMRRSRLLWYLEAAADGVRPADSLDDLRATAMRWRAELGKRWPDCQPLALYPAFAA